MAYSVRRSHSPVPEIKLDLKNGAVIECHKNSVFRIHADILVVSRNGSVESCVREKVGAQEWDRRKEKFPTTRDWKSVKISTSDCQSNFHFSKVYVVTVPVFIKHNGKKWLEEYQHMIKNLLSRTENRGTTSITIPLLGTNAGGAPKDECVRIVMDAVFKFPKFQSLRKINVVVQDWPEFTLVQDLLAEKSRQTSDEHTYKNINQNNLIRSSKSHDTLAPRNDVVARAKTSSVDPALYNHSAQHGNHSEYQKKVERRDKGANFEKNRDQEDAPRIVNNAKPTLLGNTTVKTVSSEGRALRDVSLYKCSHCEYNTISRITLPCHHVYCIECVPGDKGCPQCEVIAEKFNKDDGNNSSNRGQSLSQQTHVEDDKNKKFWCENCVHYGYNRLELPCLHVFCIFCAPVADCPLCKVDEEKSTKEENGAEPSNRDQRSMEQTHGEEHTQTLKENYCKTCGKYIYATIFELPCKHICCSVCLPYSQSCPLCKAHDEQWNKEEEDGAEPEIRIPSSRVQTFGKYHCKSCFNYTYIKLSELPCHHFCCILCKYRNCKQCKTELLNKEKGNKAELDNRIPSASQQTNVEDHGKYYCKSCSVYTFNELKELPCHHSCCFRCFYDPQKCQQCKAERCNKDKAVLSSTEETHGEGRDNTMKVKCQRCDSSLANNSPVQLACGHTFCASCSAKGCSYPSCNKELEGGRDQRPSNGSHGDDPSNRVQSSSRQTNEEGQDTMKCSDKGCNNPSCDKGLKGDRDQGLSNGSSCNNKEVQSSSELYLQEVKAKSALSTCYGCRVNIANNSPVQLACGHTFCASCASKGCKDQSCEEEPDYDCDDINLNESRSIKDFSYNHSNRLSDTSEPNARDTRIEKHSSRDQIGRDDNHGDKHKSRDRNGTYGNHRERNSSRGWDGSNGNHRDRHRSRDRNGSDGNHRDRHRSRDWNGSDGDHRDKHSRNGNDSDGNHRDKHSSIDRNDSNGNHSSIDRNGSEGNHKDNHSSRDLNGRYGNHRDNHSSDGNYRDNHRSRDRNGSDGNHSSRDQNEGKGSGGRPKNGDVNLTPKDAKKNEMCAICMNQITDPKKLDKCGHVFCRECIDNFFKLQEPVCPSCGTMYGVTIGNMPPGTMDVRKTPAAIESFKKYGSYCITYQFNSGIQGSEHPNPGVEFNGATRKAYLPASPEGVEVCKMLKVAFKRRLTFTIGRSTTTGRENVIIWNDIHHKISMIGGPTQFGYPDPTYLTRVKEELASKGVTLADIDGVSDETEFITVP